MVLGRPFRPVGEAEQSAVLVKGFSPHDGSVPDLHADPVSGLQFVTTFKGPAHPSTPVNVTHVAVTPGVPPRGAIPPRPGAPVTLRRARRSRRCPALVTAQAKQE